AQTKTSRPVEQQRRVQLDEPRPGGLLVRLPQALEQARGRGIHVRSSRPIRVLEASILGEGKQRKAPPGVRIQPAEGGAGRRPTRSYWLRKCSTASSGFRLKTVLPV